MNIFELDTHSDINNFKKISNFNENKNRKGVGITIKNGKLLMLKYYLEIKESDSIDPYKNLLMDEFNYFKKLKKYVNFALPASYSIGRKITNTKEIYNYYHVKFKKKFYYKNLFYKFSLLPLTKFDRGFSREYNINQKIDKKYIYIREQSDILHCINLFNINLNNINDIDHFEIYCKNKDTFKLNFILKQNNYKNILTSLKVDDINKQLILSANSYFNKLPVYGGYNEKNELSVYYTLTDTIQ